MKLTLFTFLFFSVFTVFSQKKYAKVYYDNGRIQQEGWLINEKKTAYWKYYYSTGKLKKEGHFKNNLQTDYWLFYRKDATKEKEGHYVNGNKESWWVFYNEEEEVSQKCQFKKDKKNGYCLVYKNSSLTKACKFKDGKLIKEWEDYASFRRENDLRDLRQ